MVSRQMHARLERLKARMHDLPLTEGERHHLVEAQVVGILEGVDGESAADRGAVLDFLTLLGFEGLIQRQGVTGGEGTDPSALGNGPKEEAV
jgi:hypothetical protein